MTALDQSSLSDGSSDQFDALSDARRRRILGILADAETPMALAELARELVARERDVRVREIDHEQLRRCTIALYHLHLPKLAATGVVEFDPDRRTAAVADSPERLIG